MDSNGSAEAPVRFTICWEKGRVTEVSTTSSLVNQFLDLVKMKGAYNTWVSYAHDLKLFFEVTGKSPEAITRADCVAFMKRQDAAGYSSATINRHLAAVSSLFNEIQLLDPARFCHNPVHPHRRWQASRQRSQSLYRKQPQRVPDILSQVDLRTFFHAVRTWRDRTLVLLMWMSCLRVSEAVAIRLQDLECSRRSIRIPLSKGYNTRMIFMDQLTFISLNRYLDKERQNLFPEVDHLFVAFRGKARGAPLTVNAVQKLIRYYAEQCGLSHLHAHLFRHTGITQLIQHGMPEPALRNMVGHRSVEALAPYLHLCDEFVQEEFERAQAALHPGVWIDGPMSRGAR
jgi:site-specific recombinase XerD